MVAAGNPRAPIGARVARQRQAAHRNDGGGPQGPAAAGRRWNTTARSGGGVKRSGFCFVTEFRWRRPASWPEGGRVPTSQDRNLWTSAAVRRPIPVRSRVAARSSGGRRGRGRRTARCQTRPRTRPVWRFGRRRNALAGGLLQLIGTAFGASIRAARVSRGTRRAGVRESEAVTKRELERE